ncbi:MAG TPA: hypothetical protein VE990_02820 [Acidimicrobiales bacterium]|nr:hypothetical protein [Acidimicrobiales bacterium]
MQAKRLMGGLAALAIPGAFALGLSGTAWADDYPLGSPPPTVLGTTISPPPTVGPTSVAPTQVAPTSVTPPVATAPTVVTPPASLPFTGSDIAGLSGMAVAAVAAGGLLVRSSRRRNR